MAEQLENVQRFFMRRELIINITSKIQFRKALKTMDCFCWDVHETIIRIYLTGIFVNYY